MLLREISFKFKLNSVGDNPSPCLTPELISKLCPISSLLTLNLDLSKYID